MSANEVIEVVHKVINCFRCEYANTNYYRVGSERTAELVLDWTEIQSAGRHLHVSQTR